MTALPAARVADPSAQLNFEAIAKELVRIATPVAAYGAVGATVTGQSWLSPVIPAFAQQSGDVGAFTRNADGTVTVRDTGWYNVAANVRTSGGTVGNRRIAALETGTVEGAGTLLVSVGSAPGNDMSRGDSVLVFTGYLAAGTVLKVWTYSDDLGVSRFVNTFGIAKIGAV